MKKRSIAIVALFAPILCQASFAYSDWKYYKDISISESGLVKLVLDDEVFSNAKEDLSDLRVIDKNGKETPFRMVVSKGQLKAESFTPNMLNNSSLPGEYSTVILDLGSNRGQTMNRLKIITSSQNFQRNAKVYGSNDRLQWFVLNDKAYIYDYTDAKGGLKAQNTTINFPSSVYGYVKIEVSDKENDPVKIESVELVNFSKQTSREYERQPQYSVDSDDTKKYTEILIDLGAKGIPTNKVSISATNVNFNRGLQIYSSNDKNNWGFLSSDYIFRYNTPKFTGENLTINFPETNGRYLRLVIQNKDDQALGISDVKAYSNYKEIIFTAQKDASYALYYGDQGALFPEYDLETYFQYLNIENSVSAVLSGQKDNTRYEAPKEPVKPLSERSPLFMPIALVAGCLVMLFLVLQFLRKK